MEPLFSQQVMGMKLIELLDWYEGGERSVAIRAKFGALMLPPVQRTPVWTPKQILDLWDSVLRGLPIGTFLFVKRLPDEKARGAAAGALNTLPGEGWNLLDGQQRLRALLLGTDMAINGNLGDRQCLWVDLAGTPKTHRFALYLTSESQPFGYAPDTGQRLGIESRRRARLEIEPKPQSNFIANGPRAAYTHELFAGFLEEKMSPMQDVAGWRSGWPPLPFVSDRGKAALFPMHVLLGAWRTATDDARLERLRSITGEAERLSDALDRLNKAFGRFEAAEIALVNVEVDQDELPMLFDRIGSGGTPLSIEERLYSIYKHHEPRVHDAIVTIYYGNDANSGGTRVGRILPPVKIAASAIRIANALTGTGTWMPDVAAFARGMSAKSELADYLSSILPVGDGSALDGPFAKAFSALYEAIAYAGGNDPGIPKVMATRLSPDLVQVMLFWIIANSLESDAVSEARLELIRFVLFWTLCIVNDAKASNLCFEVIRKKMTAREVGAPFGALYDELVEKQIALALEAPGEMTAFLVASKGSPVWRAAADRFPAGKTSSELAKSWWRSAERLLVWLQRAELEKSFGDFDPTSGRDDETPYDVDHIVPAADWRRNWQSFYNPILGSNVLSKSELDPMWASRHDLGDSIGNKWLVDLSDNRKWGADSWSDEKGKLDALRESDCFDCTQETHWTRAWGDGEPKPDRRVWSRDRLSTFQDVIEWRAAWLYQKFYDEAHFGDWTSTR